MLILLFRLIKLILIAALFWYKTVDAFQMLYKVKFKYRKLLMTPFVLKWVSTSLIRLCLHSNQYLVLLRTFRKWKNPTIFRFFNVFVSYIYAHDKSLRHRHYWLWSVIFTKTAILSTVPAYAWAFNGFPSITAMEMRNIAIPNVEWDQRMVIADIFYSRISKSLVSEWLLMVNGLGV